MGGNLDFNQLGKYERHYTKKNGGIGALDPLLRNIGNMPKESEKRDLVIKSTARVMYKDFHVDRDKFFSRIVSSIAITAIVASGVTILATRYNNLRADIQQLLDLMLIAGTLMCITAALYILAALSTTEVQLTDGCILGKQSVAEEDKKERDDIITLMTQLEKLAEDLSTKDDNDYLPLPSPNDDHLPLPNDDHSQGLQKPSPPKRNSSAARHQGVINCNNWSSPPSHNNLSNGIYQSATPAEAPHSYMDGSTESAVKQGNIPKALPLPIVLI